MGKNKVVELLIKENGDYSSVEFSEQFDWTEEDKISIRKIIENSKNENVGSQAIEKAIETSLGLLYLNIKRNPDISRTKLIFGYFKNEDDIVLANEIFSIEDEKTSISMIHNSKQIVNPDIVNIQENTLVKELLCIIDSTKIPVDSLKEKVQEVLLKQVASLDFLNHETMSCLNKLLIIILAKEYSIQNNDNSIIELFKTVLDIPESFVSEFNSAFFNSNLIEKSE